MQPLQNIDLVKLYPCSFRTLKSTKADIKEEGLIGVQEQNPKKAPDCLFNILVPIIQIR